MKTDIDILKKKAVPILKDAGVKRSSLFGSVVRGEEKRGSDIDMLIEPPKGMSLFGFVDLQQKLEKAIGRKVDLGEYSTLKPRIRQKVLSQQIRIL